MFVVIHTGGRKYIKELTAAGITKMTLPELIEFERRVWALAEKTKFPLRAVDVLNAVHREVEWRIQDRTWRDAANSRRRPGAVAKRAG